MSEIKCLDCLAWAWSDKFQRRICRITDAVTEEDCHCPELRENEARRMLSPADREALEVGALVMEMLTEGRSLRRQSDDNGPLTWAALLGSGPTSSNGEPVA